MDTTPPKKCEHANFKFSGKITRMMKLCILCDRRLRWGRWTMLRCADCRAFAHAKCVTTFMGSLASSVVGGPQPPPAPQSPGEEMVVVDGPPSRRETITKDIPINEKYKQQFDEIAEHAVDRPPSGARSEDLPSGEQEREDAKTNDVADRPPTRQQWELQHPPTDDHKQVNKTPNDVVDGPPSGAQTENLPSDGQNHVDEKTMNVTPSTPSIADPRRRPESPNADTTPVVETSSPAAYENVGVPPLPADVVSTAAQPVASPPQMTERRRQRGTVEATVRYWRKRYRLFEKFDAGVLLDEESFYSVCPEALARHISNRCRGAAVALDPFCGAGGNAIQLARTCRSVIAMDVDADKIRLAKRNATVYGVADRITFVVGDFFEVGPRMTADVLVTSPPWGGPSYKEKDVYRFGDLCAENGGGAAILRLAKRIAPRVALHLPWWTDRSEIVSYGCGVPVQIEECVADGKTNCLTAYYGPFGPYSNIPTTYLTTHRNGQTTISHTVTHDRTIQVTPETSIRIMRIDHGTRLPYRGRRDVANYGRYVKNVQAFLDRDTP